MLKSYFWNWIKHSFLVAFIFLLLNIFLGIGLYVHTTLSQQLQEKLGVYLYLNDTPGKEAEVYNQVIGMKKELEWYWATVSFVSKDDALGFLSKKLPHLTENFDKFNIENPLQSVLYITFKDKASYLHLKEVVAKNKAVIDNYNDVEKWTSLHAQNNRVLGIMQLAQFVKIFLYTMIVLLAVLVFFLLKHLLKTLSHHFHQDMYRKKIMWASRQQIIMPLLWYTLLSMLLGVVIATVFTWGLWFALNYYLFESFWIDSLYYIFSEHFLFAIGGEFVLVFLISLLVSYRYLYKANKALQ